MNKFINELPNYTYYLDECLGGDTIANILITAGLTIEPHHKHFTRGTKDEDWLPIIGKRGWILLTQDKGIRRRRVEILAIRENNVCAFVVAAKGLQGKEIGELIAGSITKIERILKKNHPPIVATILKGSVVQLQEGTPKNPKRSK